MDYIICHYDEIGLKGKNRKFFEEKLISNIKKSLPERSFSSVKRISGRIIIKLTGEEQKKEDIISDNLRHVFGIAYFSFAASCRQDISVIESKALDMLRGRKFKSFRISTQRSNKDFPLTSQQINAKVGETVIKKLKKEVSLEKPDLNLFIEIAEDYAFLYLQRIEGLRGLPVTASGRAVALISGGIDSPVASFLAMKRGIKVIFIHFHAYPYTSRASIEKVKEMVSLLSRYQFGAKLYLIPFSDIQKEIMLSTKAKLRVILYRRFMIRIAQAIAAKERVQALITGESVGQVASQTLENIRAIDDTAALPVLRPLICQDKDEIIRKAKEIHTFEISILPHEDCCVRFLPSRPETKANLKEVENEEEKLDASGMIEAALKGGSVLSLDYKSRAKTL